MIYMREIPYQVNFSAINKYGLASKRFKGVQDENSKQRR
jgi:hypothetical protein